MEAILVGMYGVIVFIIFLGNLTDSTTNETFIYHTLTADTINPWSKLRRRAIKNLKVHKLAFWLVAGVELAISLLCLVGAYRLWLGEPPVFAQLGLFLAVLLWFGGFRGIAGEWFGMWQSKDYNALPDSFHMAAMAMLILILISVSGG